MKMLIYITMFLMSGIWFVSCRSVQYVPVENIRTEYKTRDSIRVDSIYNQDSIYVFSKVIPYISIDINTCISISI